MVSCAISDVVFTGAIDARGRANQECGVCLGCARASIGEIDAGVNSYATSETLPRFTECLGLMGECVYYI